jgi:hypothetical protein
MEFVDADPGGFDPYRSAGSIQAITDFLNCQACFSQFYELCRFLVCPFSLCHVTVSIIFSMSVQVLPATEGGILSYVSVS